MRDLVRCALIRLLDKDPSGGNIELYENVKKESEELTLMN